MKTIQEENRKSEGQGGILISISGKKVDMDWQLLRLSMLVKAEKKRSKRRRFDRCISIVGDGSEWDKELLERV